jgi:hypothetical protein
MRSGRPVATLLVVVIVASAGCDAVLGIHPPDRRRSDSLTGDGAAPVETDDAGAPNVVGDTPTENEDSGSEASDASETSDARDATPEQTSDAHDASPPGADASSDAGSDAGSDGHGGTQPAGCLGDDMCPVGDSCIAGVCTSPCTGASCAKGRGEMCSAGSECLSNQCVQNKCACSLVGDPCHSQTDCCNPGQACTAFCTP